MDAEQRAPAWVLGVVLTLCLLPRLPGLGLPLLEEGHAWRQTDTAAIARNFHRHGYRLWLPEIDRVPKDKPLETPSYTNSEFPLYQWLVALGYGLVGVREWVGRLVAALCFLVALGCLFRLTEDLWGGWAATVAAAFAGLNPLGIFYSRAFLGEPLMVALLALAVWQATRFAATGSRRAWAVALVAAALAPPVKQPALHIVLPLTVAGWLAWRRGAAWWRGALLATLPVVTCLGWYAYATWLGDRYVAHFAVGGGRGVINPDLWLHNHANFYPRFATVMLVLIGGFFGWPVAALALGRLGNRAALVPLAWLAAALAVNLLAAGATISHYYYNLALLAPLAVWVGRGAGRWAAPRLRWYATVLVLLGPPLAATFPEFQRWYEVRPADVACARAVRELTPPEAYVYTLCYGTQLLYACDRRGDFLLPIEGFLLAEYAEQAAARGLNYLACGQMDRLAADHAAGLRAYLATRRLVAAGPGWAIYDLQQPVEEP